MGLTDRIFSALKTAIQLEERVAGVARNVGELAREVREIDKRLVRVEALIEYGSRGGFAPPQTPPALEGGRG